MLRATMDEPSDQSQMPRKFGTFTGVFTPTLLTILGVIMFVRLPWVVGNGGLLGAFAVMGLAMGITVCTGLSMSSIATNTRVGAGGPYAMITRSLGLEVGGSIGVPLYLSRPLGIAMYVFGFREGWLWIFPEHNALIIDLVVYGALFSLAYLSADLAFRVQYAIMAIIAVSIISVIASPRLFDPQGSLAMWGSWPGFPEDGFQGADYWIVFAVFFPATTGILAGANMSGDLENPRRSIALGTMWAIGISTVIYFVLATWASYIGSPDELINNYNFFIDTSYFGPGVLAGLLGATFSSALASAVGGPRILLAMGQNRIMPRSQWLAQTSSRGEPRNSVLLTAVLTFACLMVRDLNAIAPLVTMFFLITYLMINVVLLVESSLGLASFRPSLSIPRVIPLLGAIGCVFTMFIVNPTFGLIAVGTAVAIYFWISWRELDHTPDDMRSSIFAAFAEWAAVRVMEMRGDKNIRAWKPNLLVPLQKSSDALEHYDLLREICRPEGSLKLLGLETYDSEDALPEHVRQLGEQFRDDEIFATWTVLECLNFARGVQHGLQALQSAFFRPNMLFLTLPDDPAHYEQFGEIIVSAHDTGVGVLFLGRHPAVTLDRGQAVNLWIRRDRSGWDVPAAFEHNNLDLTLLMGFRLMRHWDAEVNVITVVPDPSEREDAEKFLAEVCDLARLPASTSVQVMTGPFDECAAAAPESDLDILGLQRNPDFDFLRRVIDLRRGTCLFVADSGRESARA